MIRTTTPTHKFTFPFEILSFCKEVQITYAQGSQIKLVKSIDDLQIDGKEATVVLTQQETKSFDAGYCYVQAKIVTINDAVAASRIVRLSTADVLNSALFELGEPESTPLLQNGFQFSFPPNNEGFDMGFDQLQVVSGGGGSPYAVLYIVQQLTDAQKKQARMNISAVAGINQNGTELLPDADGFVEITTPTKESLGIDEIEEDILELRSTITTVDSRVTQAFSDIDAEEIRALAAEAVLQGQTNTIFSYIPGSASERNHLATEQFVIDSIGGLVSSYSVSAETNPVFKSMENELTITGSFTDIDGTVCQVSSLKKGSNIYIVETGYPDRWVAEINGNTATLYQLETTKVPVTDIKKNGVSIVQETIANLLVDATPTNGSTNLIESGGVYTALAALEMSLGAKVSNIKDSLGNVFEKDANGNVTVPKASVSKPGLVSVMGNAQQSGIGLSGTALTIIPASDSYIKSFSSGYNGAIVPSNLLTAVKASLGIDSSPTWTVAEKETARQTLGISNATIAHNWGLFRIMDGNPAGAGLIPTATGVQLYAAQDAFIAQRTTAGAITPTNLNKAVTAALTDANHITLNATQQATAREVIGASEGLNIRVIE